MFTLRFKSAVLATIIVTSASVAQADVITFEGVATPYSYKTLQDGSTQIPLAGYTMTYAGQAYLFDTDYFSYDNKYANNGSAYVRLTDLPNYSTTLKSSVGPLFSVQSIDLANYDYSRTFPTTATATLTGTFADGTTISKAFSFNNNNMLTGNDFTTETLTGFTNLTSFKIAATGYYLDVDNIVVTQGATPAANVPEPASLALMGLGLASAAMIRRRKSK